MKNKSRRIFLRFIVSGLVAVFLIIWNKLTINQIQSHSQKTRIFVFNRKKPVAFNENFIVVNEGEKTTVFSAKCTHLGCLINRFENGKLVCPCHGSEYNREGEVVKGPAFKNLEILPSEILDDGTQIEIKG